MSDVVKNCPSCGSALSFSPQAGTLKCPSCGYEEQAEEATNDLANYEKSLDCLLAQADINEAPESITINCPACGAETVLRPNTVAGLCTFCKSPIVASAKAQKSIKPQGILPFKVTEKQAREKFIEWRNSLWFAPNNLKDSQLLTKMEGTYTPVWTFDFDTRTTYSGQRGDDYRVTETYKENGQTKTRTVTKTRWHYVSGVVYNTFDDILVYGCNKESRELMDNLTPWEVKGAQDYQEDTIRGFVEESYDIPIRESLSEAQCKANPTIDSTIRDDIGGDHQTISSMSVTYSNLTYKLLLLPLWETRYRYNGKDYVYVVNGQNGKAGGQRPWSAWKITAFIFMLLAIIGIIFYFITLN